MEPNRLDMPQQGDPLLQSRLSKTDFMEGISQRTKKRFVLLVRELETISQFHRLPGGQIHEFHEFVPLDFAVPFLIEQQELLGWELAKSDFRNAVFDQTFSR